MNVANTKIKLFVILSVLLGASGLVFADCNYKNNVVDVKVNKECGGTVKVTIYTDKPYNEPIVVNKKANNKYVILMPETKSSMKSEPSVSNAAGTISNVSVNTQDVSGGQGYTKIIITSQKAVTIIPSARQLSTPQTVSSEKSAVQKAKQEAQKRAALQKAKQEAENKAAAREAQKQADLQKAKQEETKRAAVQKQKQEAQRKAALKNEEQKKTVQTAVKPQVKPPSVQPIEVLEREVNTDKNAKFMSDINDPILKEEIRENTEKNKQESRKNTLNETNNKQSLIENIKTVSGDYKNISIWKLILLIGAIAFPLIVIMVILGLDKRINKRIDKSFKKETAATAKPQQGVHEEKSYNSFDEMLDKVDEPPLSYHEEQYNRAKSLKYAQSVLQSEITSMTEENSKKEEAAEEEIIEEELRQESSFENDFEKEDFEHDFEKTSDEGELAKEIELPEKIVSDEPYSPDGYLADFANVNDKEFFDELVLQSLADGNSAGLPEESPADEVFNLMREDDTKTQNIPSNDEVSEFSASTWSKNAEEISAPPQTDNNAVSADLGGGLTMLTEVKLSDNTGFYLVNYENFSSLVGHINDDYFVIKKFDGVTNDNIILKQTEKFKNSARYMVRVGKSKMVVEVSPTSMNKLLDL